MTALETIQKRHSVRTYDRRPVSEGIRNRLQQLLQEHTTGPFGTPVRFRLLDLDSVSPLEFKRLGTYGMIRGAHLFIVGAVKDWQGSQVDLGYCLEKIILEATAMGLGTCWLGGTFRRSHFARWMQLAEDELLPAITPVGHPAEKKSVSEALVRTGARSSRRKPWSALFFTGDGKTPLTEDEAGGYRNALEAVRLGPSASNLQPWRIIKDRDGCYRLYLEENRAFNRGLGKIRLQHLDIGIAMSHFELVAREQCIDGWWNPFAPPVYYAGLEHLALWETGEGEENGNKTG
ncbi:MAG: nitroreductase family protein [Dethiobacteria bacterium]|jgi:nitroreductase|nr:nitroreductase family protein [Bacillota bacterium]NMD33464.1 nitroreductase [Bacillota bacterium]HOB29165.1 nitroreductase family protein [Bacillota bacterium]HPZ41777.1 nitroreductase family protein [Bacillota bacterium]HQD52579.1 nitroreductase family protein [Bacillota bacterium]